MDEQPIVDEALRTAIVNHAAAYGTTPEDGLLGDYAVIAAWVMPDGSTYYTTHYHTPNVSDHVAMGLFDVASDIASWEGGAVDDPDL